MGGALGATIVVGCLDAASVPGDLRVRYPGGRGSVAARTTVPLSADAIERAIEGGQGALLVFENGDPQLPIVLGLIQPPGESPLRALLDSAHAKAPVAAPREARLDGERVVLEAAREVVLKCGEASLTLRRDGKVLIRGAYVETHSKGVNRIKGGSVKIN